MLLFTRCLAFGGEPASKETQLKAAFLYNFTKFVEWGPQSFADAESPIVIGVLGSGALSDELENAVRDRRINGRSINVKRVQGLAGAKSVHLLFVGAGEDAALGDIREALKGANVLTVGESEAFARSGGAITFIIEAGKMRFDINMTAAAQESVKISAQLQKLARSVRK